MTMSSGVVARLQLRLCCRVDRLENLISKSVWACSTALASSAFQQQQLRTFSKRGGGIGPKRIRKKSNSDSSGSNNSDRKSSWQGRTGQQRKVLHPSQLQNEKQTVVPPSMLAPTASPFVFVSEPALLDDDGNMVLDPSTLFTETGISPTFLKSSFEYISPHDLKHELPNQLIPEVAFLGRSNVGKSSLVNAIMRKQLCLTSKSPGRTQQAYYYGLFSLDAFLADGTLRKGSASIGYLVDLPGYGFAAAPEKSVGDWQTATQNILLDRRDNGVLQRLFLLIDSRRGPMQIDRNIMAWLDEAEIPYTIVLTKADRVGLPEVIRQVNSVCLRYASEKQNLQDRILSDDEIADDAEIMVPQSPIVHVTSSKNGMGIHDLMVSLETEFCADED